MAAHVIAHLKEKYPAAIIAFFFCKRGRKELASVRNIIRTLAYQSIQNSAELGTILMKVKEELRCVEIDSVGVRFYFRELVQKPVENCTKDVFIIIDGVDEIDTTQKDIDERATEMEVFLDSLCGLSSARIMLLSRPENTLSNLTENAIIRKVEYRSTPDDIRLYTNRIIDRSQTFARWFPHHFGDPVEYFVRKSNGLFLWATLSLRQLSKTRTEAEFLNCLSNTTDGFQDLYELYTASLSTLDPESIRLFKEVVRWLVCARRDLNVKELQVAVQCSLGSEVTDLVKFIKEACGSLVCLNQDNEDQPPVAHLIHETLHSFLVDHERCPRSFLVARNTTETEIALTIIQVLCSTLGNSNTLLDYAAQNFPDHLSKASSSGPEASKILGYLHQLFTSTRYLTAWIRHGLRPPHYLGLDVNIEENSLEQISQWLTECKSDHSAEEVAVQLREGLEWREQICRNPSKLGGRLGRSAIWLWMSQEEDDYNAITAWFALGLKYYLRETGRRTKRKELEELITTTFRPLAAWCQSLNPMPQHADNTAAAFFVLREWDQAIFWYRKSEKFRQLSPMLMEWLGNAYHNKCDYSSAADCYKKSLNPSASPEERASRLHSLALVYVATGDFDTLIETYHKELVCSPENEGLLFGLIKGYIAKKDYSGAVDVCEHALQSLHFLELGSSFRELIESIVTGSNDYAWGIRMYKNIMGMSEWRWDPVLLDDLARFHKVTGDVPEVIRLYEEAANSAQLSRGLKSNLLTSLGRTYQSTGDVKSAIEAYENAIDLDPANTNAYDGLSDILKKEPDFDAVINLWKMAVNRNLCNPKAWAGLGDAFLLQERADEAVKAYGTAIEKTRPAVDSTLWKRLETAYRVKGAPEGLVSRYWKEIKEVPVSWRLCLNLGELYISLEDPQAAISAFRYGLQSKPDDFELCEALSMIDASNRTAAVLQAAIDESPLEGGLWKLLGRIQRVMGDSDTEQECFRRAAEVSSNRDGYAWLGFASALRDAGTEKSRNAIDTAVRICAQGIYNCGCARDYLALGVAMKVKGHLDESVEALRVATQKDESQEQAWCHLGRIYLSQGEIDLAAAALLKSVSLDKHCAHTLCALTQVYLQKENMDSAIKFAKECVKVDKNCAVSWGVVLRSLQKEGKAKELKEAIKTMEGVSQSSRNIDLLSRLGNIFDEVQEWDLAMQVLKRVVEEESSNAEAWCNLSQAYLAKGDKHNALLAAQHSVDLDHGCLVPWRIVWQTYETNLGQRISILEKAADRFPKNHEVWCKLSQGYRKGHKSEWALACCRITELQDEPGCPVSHLVRGHIYFEKNDFHGAIVSLKKGLEVDPTCEDGWVTLAEVYLNQGALNESVAALDKALELNPSSDLAWGTLSEAYRRNGELEKAIEVMVTHLTAHSDSMAFQQTLCHLYEGCGQWGTVFAIREAMNKRYPAEKWSWIALGRAFIALNQWESAFELAEKAPREFEVHAHSFCCPGPRISYKHILASKGAIEKVRAAVFLNPSVPLLWHYYIDCVAAKEVFDSQELEECADMIELALRTYPKEEWIVTAAGLYYRSQGEVEKAIRVMQDFIRKEDQTTREGWHILLQMLVDTGRNADAISTFKEAVVKFPNDYVFHHQITGAYLDVKGAIEVFEQAQSEVPTDADIKFRLIRLYRRAGRIQDAATIIHSTIETTSVNCTYLRSLGRSVEDLILPWSCDACGHVIHGYMYICEECEQGELCSDCKGVEDEQHRGHVFMRLPTSMWLSEQGYSEPAGS